MMAKMIDVEAFDRKFDAGESVIDDLDLATARRPGLVSKRVNLDMPQAMVSQLDTHARKRGVTRQALIKMWLADRLEAVG
jgi:CopG antitoxin of type II toxin-antitoxin system